MVQQWMRDLKESAKSLKNTRIMVTCAMLLAVEVALNATVAIYLSATSRITFGFLAVAACGYLFGPFPAMLIAALSDILVYVLHPTGFYFPGYTITAALGGLIYGLFFYQKEVKLIRILLAQAFVSIFLNLVLNSVWSVITQGKALAVILPIRLTANAIGYPIYVALIFFLLLFLKRQFRSV
jgi:riboflavin transporter